MLLSCTKPFPENIVITDISLGPYEVLLLEYFDLILRHKEP